MSATETLAKRQDEATTGFHQSWFPLALASELESGQVIGRDFLGTRVILYRDADRQGPGAGRLLPASGRRSVRGRGGRRADPLRLPSLAIRLRGALRRHSGRRQDPAGRPDRDLSERGGLGPHLGLQRGGAAVRGAADPRRRGGRADLRGAFPGHARGRSLGGHVERRRFPAFARAARPARGRSGRRERGRAQHRIPDRVARLRPAWPDHRREHVLAAPGLRRRRDVHAVQRRAHRAWPHHGLLRLRGAGHGQGEADVAERLDGLRQFVQRLLAEDAPVLDTIRFRPRVLVASDRHLARFFKYVREFPRAVPPDA